MNEQNHGLDFNLLIPVYEDLASLEILFQDLEGLDAGIFYVLIDDCSWACPVPQNFLSSRGLKGKVITLTTNCGHQKAIEVGINWILDNDLNSKPTAVMDGDGEDRAVDLIVMMDHLKEGADCEAVVATRGSRNVPKLFSVGYTLYLLLVNLLAGANVDFGNFSILSPRALLALGGTNTIGLHYPASIIKAKIPVKKISFERGARYFGQSKMSWGGLILHGLKAISVFSENAALRIGIFCLIMVLLSLTAMCGALIIKLFGVASPGWFSTTLGILFIVCLVAGVLATLTIFILLKISGSKG